MYYAHSEFNAREVEILIPKSIKDKFKYIGGFKDNNGRFLLINCEIEETQFTIINLYSPTKDNINAQISFRENVKTKCESLEGETSTPI